MKKLISVATTAAIVLSSFSAFASFYDKPEDFSAEQLTRLGVPKEDTVAVDLSMKSGWGTNTPSSSALSQSTDSKSATFGSTASLDMTNVAKEWSAYIDAAVKLLGEEASDEAKAARRAFAISSAKISGDFTVTIKVRDTASGNKDVYGNITNTALESLTEGSWKWSDKTLELFEQKGTPTYDAATKTFTLVMTLKESPAINVKLDEYLETAASNPLTLSIPDNTITATETSSSFDTYAVPIDGVFAGSVTIDPLGKGVEADKSVVNFNAQSTETVRLYKSSGGGGGGGGGGSSTVTIKFNTNDGSEIADMRVNRNTAIGKLPTPSKEGYVFAGWYTDAALTKPYNGTETVTSSMTLYAKWDPAPVVTTGPDDGPDLNYQDHFAYIIGYNDGTVRPTNNITRAEVATIIFRLFTDETRAKYWTKTNSFSDVDVDDWYNNAISTVANAGIVNGYENGAFEPNAPITRAEFAAIASRFATGDHSSAVDFTDIAGHWAADSIKKAAALGWVTGYEDGTFAPDKNITRAEAMTIINRVTYRSVDAEGISDDAIIWPDNDKSAWYYTAVEEATNSHNYTRDELGSTEKWSGLRENADWDALEKASSQVSDVNISTDNGAIDGTNTDTEIVSDEKQK